jgi:hypothetical protein
MKTQWQIYQELELIPDKVPRPKTSLWAHLLKPLRRSLSNSFVRELADRHRIFLFNRCLDLKHAPIKDAQQADTVPSKIRQWSRSGERSRQSTSKASAQAFKQQAFKLQAQQQPPNRTLPFWWAWYDAR